MSCITVDVEEFNYEIYKSSSKWLEYDHE